VKVFLILGTRVTPMPVPLFNPFAERARRGWPRWRADASGVSAVEFALLAPLFMGLVFVSLMISVLYLAKSELDAATQAAARLVMTGQATTSAQLQTGLCNNIGGIFTCGSFMVNLKSYSLSGFDSASTATATPTITYNADGTVSNNWGTSFGAVGSIMVLQVLYQFPVIGGSLFSFGSTSNGSALLISTAVFVNE